MKRFFIGLLALLSLTNHIASQEYQGTTGLIQVQNAETDSAGTFRGGFSFIHRDILPDMSYYNDGKPFNAPGYSIGITAWPWIQLSYTGTIVKMHKNGDDTKRIGYYNEDRHINFKLRPLKEGKYWPAIAVGWDDIGNFKTLKINKKSISTNNFFECLYIAGSKHFEVKGYELGGHIAYRYYPSEKNKDRRGVAGGITVRPAFYRPLRVVAEWDGVGVNVGADVLLWRHLYIQTALVHGRGFTGSLSYHYTIKF